MKRILLLALAFANLGGLSHPHPVQAKEAAPVASQELQHYLTQTFPAYRLANTSDYETALKGQDQGQAWLQADFNQDGQADYAVLLINESAQEYRVYYLLRQAQGFHADLLLTRKFAGESSHPIRTPMFFKPAGQSGISGREYNGLTAIPHPEKLSGKQIVALKASRRAFYTSVPAIEVWTGSKATGPADLSDLAYCSRTWFYQAAALKAFDACD